MGTQTGKLEHVSIRRYAGGALTRPLPRNGVSVSESSHASACAAAQAGRADTEAQRVKWCELAASEPDPRNHSRENGRRVSQMAHGWDIGQAA